MEEEKPSRKRGRHKLEWDELAESTKKRYTGKMASQFKAYDRDTILRLCASMLTNVKEHSLSYLVTQALDDSAVGAAALSALKKPNKPKPRLSPTESAALLYDARLSKSQYMRVQQNIGDRVLPSYPLVLRAKKMCRPDPTLVDITDEYAQIPLQVLLNTTAARMIPICEDSLRPHVSLRDKTKFNLVCSWGMDGSTGFSPMKMGFRNQDKGPMSDQSLLTIGLIPLCLQTCDGTVIWRNKGARSGRAVRPIRLSFEQESKVVVLSQKERVEREISMLQDFDFQLDERFPCAIGYMMHFTLLDGKILAYVLRTGGRACPLCGQGPSKFNDPENLYNGTFKPKEGSLQYGISPLHAWLRTFDFLLGLSSKLDLKLPEVRVSLWFTPIDQFLIIFLHRSQNT